MRRSSTLLLTALLGTACQPSDNTNTTASGTSETETSDDSDNSTTEPEPEPEPDPSTTTGTPSGSGTASDTELPTATWGDTETDGEGDCGDGLLQEGEGCDDGMFDPNGPCLPGCEPNVCGDGHVYTGVEDCDAGPQNGVYGGSCSDTCTNTGIPSCGDGILQEEYEACEEGQTNGDGLLCNECQFDEFRYIFLSSVKVNGAIETDLPIDPDTTGIYRADALCNLLAFSESLPGTYYAWLSDNNNNDDSDAADQIKRAGKSALNIIHKNRKVADSWQDLVTNGPSDPVVWTEGSDEVMPAPAYVWTNTSPSGTSLGEVCCDNWTNTDLSGWTATTTEGLDWTSLSPSLCLYEFHLYCVQGAPK